MSSLEGQTAGYGGVRFLGRRGAYWRLLMRGGLYLMVTLGIYRFWLTTDLRRFLWANTVIDGDCLEYSGRPAELLIGFLTAIAILIPVYAGFFLAAFDLGPFGRMSGLIAFAALGVLGQYAVYRARRYRLTRTIFRGLRFHLEGSAGAYALRASAWWIATALTLGLAYPFQLASLERYKMRHTYYGNLAGAFAGSGFYLFLRGLLMWLLVMAPLVLSAATFITAVDWAALGAAISAGGSDVMARIETSNPGFADVLVFTLLMAGISATMAALLYPAFQSMVLRWWCSGLRLGGIAVLSRLRTRDLYGAYVRFLWYAILFCIGGAIAAVPLLIAIDALGSASGVSAEIAETGLLLIGYVIAALGFSTVYRATAMLSLWQLGVESLHLSGLEILDRVTASGRPSSALGEGLADALKVGGF
jgi:uncharacterized membrane protein YjgN (DUF898 family)